MEKYVSLGWSEFPGRHLIEDADDPKTPLGKITADVLEEGLANVQFDEAEFNIYEIDQVELGTSVEDSQLATLNIHL